MLEKHIEKPMKCRPNPLRDAWYAQKWQAKKRGIIWNLTFKQWLDIWQRSGKLELRGKGRGKYCMARLNDIGPYDITNVYIQKFEDNNKDQHLWNPRFDIERNAGVIIKDALGSIKIYPNLKTASRDLQLSYDMLWQRKKQNKKYKGYEFL